jgi:glycosyltransferase involved in cell wall biosynthesis
MKVAFVTNICPYYRVRTFELLARHYETDYYFFSAGDDWYWQQHGVRSGTFHHEYLWGFRLGRTRVTPTLPWKLWRTTYDVYVKCINGRFALPITYLIARLKRKPFILWSGIWMRLQTPMHRRFFPLTRYIYRHADAIVVYGEHVKRYLLTEGVPEERVFVAAHAVQNSEYNRRVSDAERSALRRKLNIEAGQKIVLYLGRLEVAKGLSYLIEAFASLRREDTVLILAGSGSDRTRLELLAHERGVADRTRFPGYIAPDKTVPYYALAWVYVLPSMTTPAFKEPWGLVVNEAFNQGTPVIATEAVGAAAGGLVQDEVNGFVTPERDSASLAQALRRILDDRNLREHLAHNARQTIIGWDNERMVSGFRQAIDSLINLQRRNA